MDFGKALEALKLGSRLARTGWNGTGMYVVRMPGYPTGIPANQASAEAHGVPAGTSLVVREYLAMWTADGSVVPWVASQTDLLAEDWTIVLARQPVKENP
jgi:hypothetical protein